MSKVSRSLHLTDFYKMYRTRCIDKGIVPKSEAEHKKIIKAMGESMSDILLENGIVAIPWRLGDVYYNEKKKTNRIVVSGGVSVHPFNDHTDGIQYKVSWLSSSRKNKKRTSWAFSLYRGSKRKGAQLMKGGKKYPNFQMLLKKVE